MLGSAHIPIGRGYDKSPPEVPLQHSGAPYQPHVVERWQLGEGLIFVRQRVILVCQHVL